MEKGQTSNLMIFIILIGLFMVLYILALPPSERDPLLNESFDDEDKNVGEIGSLNSRNLLNERPGEVFPLTSNKQGHSINTVGLFFREEPSKKVLSNGFTVSSSLFGSKEKELSFSVENLEDLDSIKLVFVSDVANGELIIELNGFTVFNDVALGNVEVILPIDRLENRNLLLFKTSGIGASFWNKNEYALSNVGINQIFENENNEEDRFFVLSQDEFDNMKSAVLNYDVYCNLGEGTLSIKLNGDAVSSEALPCAKSSRRLELIPNSFFSGTNTLTFSINKGDYLIDKINLESSLFKTGFKQYVFLLTKQENQAVLNGDNGVVLDMSLGGGLKVADVLINGFTVKIDTADDRFKKDISEYIQEGENVIEIVPKREFEITSLRLDFV
ncbi:hypothetical protein HYW75_04665 [Candidatus Pacearchaeota archaeon]|nr:hypothetical protein [Candidatus Pacearchaeota archaeon]